MASCYAVAHFKLSPKCFVLERNVYMLWREMNVVSSPTTDHLYIMALADFIFEGNGCGISRNCSSTSLCNVTQMNHEVEKQ